MTPGSTRKPEVPLQQRYKSMRILIVYFSRTGHTKRLAERLARELGTSSTAITERRSRRGFFGYQRSLIEAVTGRDATIDKLRNQPREHDLVLIGTPIWGWHLSSPVRAFARQHAKALRHVAFFCTMGGSGDRIAFAELQRLVGHRPLATLALTEHELTSMSTGEVKAKIDRFVSRLLAHASEAKSPERKAA
jgi:flavodoxin